MESFLTPYGLSNSGQEKLQFRPFWGGPKPGWSDSVRAGIIKSHNLFVLRPILVKFHIRTRLIESFPTTFWTWWWAKEKLHFTPVHTLHKLKRDKMRFHHFGGSDSFPLTYGMCSCDLEKLSILLEAHHKAQSSEIFLSFLVKN